MGATPSRNRAKLTLFVAVIAVIAAAIETDLFIPSLPAMQSYYSASSDQIQLLISMNFLGLCISSLFYGPLSDSYGRKPILLLGLVIFTIGALGCLFSPSLNGIIFWRFIEGVGSSTCFVVPGAMIFDLYSKEEAARILGILNSIITVVMAGSPLAGGFIHVQFGWRANFLFLALIAVLALILAVFLIKESLHKEDRAPLHIKSILKGYYRLITNTESLGYLLIICCAFGAYMVYISGLSLIFVNHLHISEAVFPYYQGAVLLAFALVSVLCGRIIHFLGMKKALHYSTIALAIGATLLLLTGLFAPNSAILTTVTMSIFAGGIALMITIVFGNYMEVIPEVKGIASALCNAFRLCSAALFVALAGMLFTGTITPVAIFIFTLAVISTIILVWLQWNKLHHASETAS
ncbi:multidrug effflux MFS transporter [Piscirickettsia litoralis]|uniref:Bcr/CflA family efflux transporter n=1 Tax=Piscirickettsia litoralis TaxID=1891921 RepID=A0ABX3A4P4_9GAMM|nr:multidrug effflux MFS transporter [Piscirickettsia litoralis]ODN43584.1 multidrug transporter [Piscirickettsia litoralis]